MPLWIAGASILGGAMQSNSNKSAAESQSKAQIEAARIAADAQRFRPVGVTTAFGKSNFGTDAQGNLTSAGYELSPQMAAQRDAFLQQSRGYSDQAEQGRAAAAPAFGAAQGMFSLGQQFMPTSTAYSASPESQAYAAQLRGLSGQILPSSYDTTAAAQQYMQQQQALQQPGRDRSYANVQQNLQNTGRTGLSVAQGGMLGAANPEMQAYYNAIAQSDAALAANASDKARANLQGDITFGTGLAGTALTSQQNAEALARQNLFGNIQAGQDLTRGGLNTLTGAYGVQSAAYDPYKTTFGLAQSLESAGQGALNIGSELGGRSATAGANVGQTLYGGGMAAAQTMGTANKQNPWADAIGGALGNQQLMSGVANMFNRPSGTFKADPNAYAFGTNSWD
jgi:hypothetical protein